MKLLDELLELMYPTRCAFCHKLSQNKEKVCRNCLGKLPYTSGAGQKQKFPFISGCVSPFYYEEDVRKSLLRYKFRGLTAYAQIYGEFLAKCIDENQISCDIITWIPLSRRRLRQRGYDQARLLAEATARVLGVDCVPLLRKRRDNPAQSGTGSPEKRRANVSGVYIPVNTTVFKGKSILLVDDIVTTGATLSEGARTLITAGAAEVYAAAVARSRQ